MWKKIVKDYLTFSKGDRIALLFLTGIFVLVLIVPAMISTPTGEPADPDNVIGQMKQLLLQHDSSELPSTDGRALESPARKTAQQRLFHFDPNTITVDQWVELGVNEKTARTIDKYRKKGGTFRKAGDLYKIYTLDKSLAARLVPWVKIPETTPADLPIGAAPRTPEGNARYEENREIYSGKKYRPININEADSSMLTTLPQIGPWRASAILRYRSSLGGFVSVDQVREVRHMPDSVFQNLRPYLVIDAAQPTKINLNTATFEQLVRHPYIDKNLANAIVKYRDQHGFNTLQDLKNIHIVDVKTFDRIAPYLRVD